ncbi:unnamed protein product [Caenorhabditis brenneri]
MNCYCEGTLGGICRFAESLRPRSNPRVQHNMDAYLLGNPTPARIVLMMFHNQHYHHVPIIQQAVELECLMAARAQCECTALQTFLHVHSKRPTIFATLLSEFR